MPDEDTESRLTAAAVQFVHYSTKVNDYTPCDSGPGRCKFTTHHRILANESTEEAIERIHVSNMGSAAGMGVKARRRKDDYVGIIVDRWGLREKELPGIKAAWAQRFQELDDLSAPEPSGNEDDATGSSNEEVRIADLRAERGEYDSGERPVWHLLADDYTEATRLHQILKEIDLEHAGDEQFWEGKLLKAEAQSRIVQNLYQAVKGDAELKDFWARVQQLPVKNEQGQYYKRSEIEDAISTHDSDTRTAQGLHAAYDEMCALPEDSELKRILTIGDENIHGSDSVNQERKKKSHHFFSLKDQLDSAAEAQKVSGKNREKILDHVKGYYESAQSDLARTRQNKQMIEENYKKWLYAGWPHENKKPPEKFDAT